MKRKSDFNELLREALALEKEIRAHQALGYKAQKLSAKAFLREALQNAGKSEKQIRALWQTLEEKRQILLNIWSFITALKQNFAGQQEMGAIGCLDPPRENLVSFAPNRDMTALLVELSTLGGAWSVLDLVAVATLWAMEECPEAFGAIEDSLLQNGERWNVKHQRHSELLEKIPKEFTPEDLSYLDIGGGLCKVAFRVSAGEVPLHPTLNAGERLVSWLMQHPDAL